MLDVICDAVKVGIGVDDRWFCVRRLDWAIVKLNPTITVGVSQSVTEHHRACHLCGAIRPLSSFTLARRGLLGRGRECYDCRTAVVRSESLFDGSA